VIKKNNYRLSVITDTRKKDNKYTRIVKMQPEYADRNVFYDIREEHDPDMIEGNMQVKGIEPGYNTADDAPDADEGAWFYLDQHIFLGDDSGESVKIGKRERNLDRLY